MQESCPSTSGTTRINEEEYGGTWELMKEEFMTSFALFMVIWIIFTLPYTMTDCIQSPPAPYWVQTTLLVIAWKDNYKGTSATLEPEKPMFPELKISVLASVFFMEGCDLKLLKEPSTLEEQFLNCPSPTISSWIPS